MKYLPGHFSNDEVCLSATNHASLQKGFLTYRYRVIRS
jgi:hypothetical protein